MVTSREGGKISCTCFNLSSKPTELNSPAKRLLPPPCDDVVADAGLGLPFMTVVAAPPSRCSASSSESTSAEECKIVGDGMWGTTVILRVAAGQNADAKRIDDDDDDAVVKISTHARTRL